MSRRNWVRRVALAACMGLVLHIPAMAAEPVAPAPDGEAAEVAAPEEADEDLDLLPEVVVYGTSGKLIAGLTAESELDAAALAAYGASSIGDLIGQVAQDVDNGTEEGPVILINGRPADGITSVNQLPAEAVQSFQVLPPQAAAALGYAPTRRVINVVLRQTFGQEIANVTASGATAGRGYIASADFSSIRLQGNNFRNFSLQLSKAEPLLEAHRNIITDTGAMPYDLVGNVVSWPLAGGEVDPALSALAGMPVTVAGVPLGTTDPAIADFASLANTANVSDMGRYRTLVPDQYRISLSGNANFPLPRGVSLNVNAGVDRSQSVSRSGATPVLLHVPASSPYSPFSQDVGIARYLGDALRQESDPLRAYINGTLNKQLGQWRMSLNGNFNWRESVTVSERRVDTAALQAAIDAGTVNPFDPISASLLGDALTDRATSQGHNAVLQFQASRTVLTMPAGPATFSGRAEVRSSEQKSKTVGTQNVPSNPRKRQDELAFASLQVPLLGPRGQQNMANLPPGATLPPGMVAGQGGSFAFGMGAELNGAARDVSAVGTLFDFGYGLNARLGNRINMRINVNHEKVAPQPEALTNPVITIDDYRTYDFIRQETVLVRYITGGNPDLDVERRRRITIGGQARPFAKHELNFNAEYQRTIGRDQTSALPAVSEDVQLAFPDRYQRDPDGRLVLVDARLVSFERSETEQIRWGGNYRRAFRVPPPSAPASSSNRIMFSDGSAGDELQGAGWRLNANFTHTWQLTSKRLARAGLPEQDLLAGGVGTGNSQPRHTVVGRVGMAHNGTGTQLSFNWRSGTSIIAGTAGDPNEITFSPVLRFDLNAFANLGTVYPESTLLRDVRVTLSVQNLLDEKQRVREADGTTPLRYQPYLLDSMGRVVSLSLRKMF